MAIYVCVCVFMWGDVGRSKGGRTLQTRQGFQAIERSHRRIYCPQNGRGERERRNCGVLWRVNQGRRIRRGRKFEIQGRSEDVLLGESVGLSETVKSITRTSGKA